MTTPSIYECPTISTCKACDGQRTTVSVLPGGAKREQKCTWCEGCGFLWPERLAEWEQAQKKEG